MYACIVYNTHYTLFLASAYTMPMIKDSMDEIRLEVDYLKSGQTPVVTFEQPLFALEKEVQ